ncbi:MAG: response regulator [Steroidobacteraceae bacterium]
MTMGKRALIVDDSRSARVILSRMLEQHGLAVDTAESAEQALEFLQQHRPDVIFMDHLMPGMDGFQAVQAIKSDPQTATIPLMMYTSQEGEVYVSQARALGAVGVLPKTVRPVDVSRVLYQLHLLPERRQDRSTLFRRPEPSAAFATPEGAEPRPQAPPPARVESAASADIAMMSMPVSPGALNEMSAGLRQSVQQLIKDQLAEQRRFMLATFEAFARRLGTEIREQAQKPATPTVVELPAPEPPPRQWWPVALTALLAVIPALVLGLLYRQELKVNRDYGAQISQLQDSVAKLARTRPLALAPAPVAVPADQPGDVTGAPQPQAASSAAAPAPARPEYVPYGDIPFGGARLARLQSPVASLEAQRFRGRIVLEYSVGDFASRAASPRVRSGGSVAADSQVRHRRQPVRRLAVGRAAPVGRLRHLCRDAGRRSGGAITVESVSAGRRHPVEYPEQTEATTAGTWNTVAAQNNRVDFRVVTAE